MLLFAVIDRRDQITGGFDQNKSGTALFNINDGGLRGIIVGWDMLAILLLALVGATNPPPTSPSSGVPSKERMERALAACGLKPDQFRIAFDDDVQDIAMTIIAPATALNRDQYACLAQMDKQDPHFLFFDDDNAALQFTEARNAD
jgi:hypothetical protein